MKRYLLTALFLLLGGGIAALTWRFWPSKPQQPPLLDSTGVDPIVWRVIESARAEVERTPQSVRVWGRLGMVLLAHQYRAEAVVCLARAEQLDPHDARWPYYQAMAVYRSDPESAIAALSRVLRIGLARTEPRLLLAELLLQRGRLNEAESLFGDVLNLQPDDSRAHLGMAKAAFAREDFSASLEHLRPVQDDPHTRKAAHMLLAEVQLRRGDRTAAEKALREGQDLPDDTLWPDPLYEPVQEMVVGYLHVISRAAALLKQDQVEQAISLLQRISEDYPQSDWACLLLGRAWLRLGNFAAAEAALRESLRRAPESVETHFYLGVVLSEQKKFADAVPFFRKTVELKPDYALAWYNLGICRKQQGNRADALTAFRKAIDCKPQLAEARINLGALLFEEGQLDAAEEQLRQGVQQLPNDKRARELLETLRKRKQDSQPRKQG